MRAAILQQYGEPPLPGEFDDPEPRDDAVVLDVEAAGLNPVDLRWASGAFYLGAPKLPSVAGLEGVGRLPDGRSVYFESPVAPYGSCAERALVERSNTIPLPREIDPALATCFGIAGLAAWLALDWRSSCEGETVLVLGASGVVGQIAVQAAQLLGAGRVVAAARNRDGLERARQLGADAVVQIDAVDDLTEAFRDACGDGADLVIDPVWGEPAAAAVEACRAHGRLVQIGESAGSHSSIASVAVRPKLLTILGHTNALAPRGVKRKAFRRMVEHAAAGQLTVDIERVPLDQIADAWRRQQSSPHRKLVVVP